MNLIDCMSFAVRVIAFLVTYYFMIDYLFICNIDTKIGSLATIIGLILITLLYYPLRGKYLKLCHHCGHREQLHRMKK